MAADGALGFPVIAVNEAQTKHLFDNRYGTGQSTIDGILRATNILLAGRRCVVAGYGWVGRGIASRFSGMGARVTVVEIDPVRAIEALMDGHQVMTAGDAAAWGEVFVTATGNINVFREEHFRVMADGSLLANSGHFDAELDLAALTRLAEGHIREVRDNVREYDLGEKKLYLLAEGRLVNLGAAEGHPAAVMDMSFAGQALSVQYVAANHGSLSQAVTSCRPNRCPDACSSSRRGILGHDRGADPLHELLGARHLAGLQLALQGAQQDREVGARRDILRGCEQLGALGPRPGMLAP
jgi:adenosylhomocysteinase